MTSGEEKRPQPSLSGIEKHINSGLSLLHFFQRMLPGSIGIEVALRLCSPAKGHGRATAVIYARKASCGVGSGGSRVCGPILRLRKPQTAQHPLQECVG